MAAEDAQKTGWRGTHGIHMKSVFGWIDGGNGTNHSGFNALPAGYFHMGSFDGGMEATADFWSAAEPLTNDAWVRFLGAPLVGVNRYFDNNNDKTNWGLACRCIKDGSF